MRGEGQARAPTVKEQSMHGEGKVGDAGKPASRWYRRDGPVPTVRNAISAPLLQRGSLSPHGSSTETRWREGALRA